MSARDTCGRHRRRGLNSLEMPNVPTLELQEHIRLSNFPN